MSKIQIKTEEVTIYKPVPAKWYRVLLWLVSFGKRGETFLINVFPGKKYTTPPDPRTSINCRCTMPPTVPPKDFVDLVDAQRRRNTP